MYNWIWRTLPGPLWVKIITAAVLISAIIVVLFGWVFPAVEPLLPTGGQTVG